MRGCSRYYCKDMYHFIRKNLETYQKDPCPVCIAQNYSQNTQSGKEFNWLYHADLSSKQKITLSNKKKRTKRNMKTFVKFWFARHVCLWVLSSVFSIKHIIVSVQFHISETGLQFVPPLKKSTDFERENLTHHLQISLDQTCGVKKGLYYFGMDPITWIPKSS